MGAPDVCKVPAPPAGPVPTPFPNTAMLMQASGGTCTSKVKVGNKKVLTQKSEIPMSSGDEAGSVGGVTSNKIKGECTFKKGSSKVKMEGNPVLYMGAMAAHNGKGSANMPAGAILAVSEAKVTVMM